MANQSTAFFHKIMWSAEKPESRLVVFLLQSKIYTLVIRETNCEIVWASLQLPCQKKVPLASFYRLPHSSIKTTMQFMNSANNVFSDQAPAYPHVLLVETSIPTV